MSDAFSNSFFRSMGAVDGLINSAANRKRQKTLAEQQELLFAQGQEDRVDNKRRQRLVDSQNKTLWDQQQADRTQNLEDQQNAREHLEALRPYEIQQKQAIINASRANVDASKTTTRLNQLKIDNAKRDNQTAQARDIYLQAMGMAQAGNMDAAKKKFMELKKYGHDPEAFLSDTPQGRAAPQIIDDVLRDKMPLNHPEFTDLVKKVLQPSFVQSQRDGKKLELTGVLIPITKDKQGNEVPREQWTYTPQLRYKDSGKTVPATVFHNSEEEDAKLPEGERDEAVQLTFDDLISAVQAHMMVEDNARQAMGLAGQAMGFSQGPTLEDQLTEAQIATEQSKVGLNDARAAKTNAEAGAIGAPGNQADPALERLVESYKTTDPEAHAIAQTLMNYPEFTADDGPDMVAAVNTIMIENETFQPQQAAAYYINTRRIAEQVPLHTDMLLQKHPGIDKQKAMQLTEDDLTKPMSAQEYQKRLDQLIGQRDRKKQAKADKEEQQGRLQRAIDDKQQENKDAGRILNTTDLREAYRQSLTEKLDKLSASQ